MHELGEEGEVEQLGLLHGAGQGHAVRQLHQQLGLVLAAPLGGEARGLGEHQPPRLEHRAQRARVEPRGSDHEVHEHVEPQWLRQSRTRMPSP